MDENMHQHHLRHLETAITLSHRSRETGNHPFAALLLGPTGDVVIESVNTHKKDKGPGHAELNVAREAAVRFDAEFLQQSTLVTTVEPCCMCSGGIYWAGIGTVVFGLTEKRLAELTGDNPENLTMDLPCQQVFSAGQRKTTLYGPYPELEEEIVAAHEGFW